ncbi:MAG TPA: hypothetical protein VGH28_19155 [Polyangiaceae bacterium]|jgi:hypothetical protein
MGFRSSALLIGGSLLIGCSVLTSLDELGEGGASPDGSATDGATGSDATGSDAGSNLLQNPSFDDSQGGCGPGWGNGYGMTFTRVSPGRTGPYACEVCIASGATDSYQMVSLQPIPVQAGPYYAEGWVMTPDGGTAVQGGVGIQVFYDIDAGISQCSGIGDICQGSMTQQPTSTWAVTSASFVANGPGSVTISFHAYGDTPSSCFLVDDAALYAQ